MKILNLGCGRGKIKDSINLDIVPLEEVDIVYNLEETPLPFFSTANAFVDITHKRFFSYRIL